MMSYLWGGMILIGIIYAAFTGNLEAVTDAAIQSAQDAVTLCITMMGVMSMWVGLMEIAKEAGIVERLSAFIGPVLRRLFPNVPKGSKAEEYISLNVIANVMGLGWAATPAGLKAMEELGKLEEDRRRTGIYGHEATLESALKHPRLCPQPPGTASNEMCTFLIINISSIQLIPINIIAYRSQYGSVNPAAIIGAGIIATTANTLVAILYCRLHDR